MGSVFTNRFKTISELVQNSRRAGASGIKIAFEEANEMLNISVEDDGCGIADLNALLTLSESGWGEEVTNSDNPFGMGFISTMFSAQRVDVYSNGQSISINTAEALALNDIGDFMPCDDAPTRGTKVVLHGVCKTEETRQLIYKIEQMAKYSSLPIFFNEVELSRPYTLERLSQIHRVVDTPFGQLVLCNNFSTSITIVLQDACIYSSYTYRSDTNYLFANHTVKARMPDRDVILNEEETIKSINQWIMQFYADELKLTREQLQNDTLFVEQNFEAIVQFAKPMLNDIDYLPAHAFWGHSYPTLREDHNTDSVNETELNKESASKAIITADTYSAWESPLVANFLYFSGAMTLRHGLDAGHWITPFIIASMQDSDIEVHCSGVQTVPISLDFAESCDLHLADSVCLTNKVLNVSVQVIDGFAPFLGYCDDDGEQGKLFLDGKAHPEWQCLVVTKGVKITDDILLQLDSYTDDDVHQNANLDFDLDSLNKQVLAATGADPSEVLKSLIGVLPPAMVKALTGKKFTLEHDGSNFIIAEAA